MNERILVILGATSLFQGCFNGERSATAITSDELQWVTDFRGSGQGHVEGSRLEPVYDVDLRGYQCHLHPSGDFVLWTGVERESGAYLILENRLQQKAMFRITYLSSWEKVSVSKVIWTPGGKLYFEQQNASRHLTAQCLIDLNGREFEYVRVMISAKY